MVSPHARLYPLTYNRERGRWECTCDSYRYSESGHCSHLYSLALVERGWAQEMGGRRLETVITKEEYL